ncbi:MAG: DUF262 domain-containing protein [Chitinophagaceae bacterium]
MTTVVDQFLFPSYQREYVWCYEEIKNLYEDLLKNVNTPNIEHFLGTIVLSLSQNTPYIIDGQQRITTVFMHWLNVLQTQNILFYIPVIAVSSFPFMIVIKIFLTIIKPTKTYPRNYEPR